MRQSSETNTGFLNILQSKVLGMYSDGLSYEDIGAELSLSEHSIALILQSAVKSLNAKNLNHAIVLGHKFTSKRH
ncbi:MAG: hypothetical protein JKX93_03410 [Rhizobiaceae bacterium]|nr:hypothetical protein [Rhizobiaceae bacterium]